MSPYKRPDSPYYYIDVEVGGRRLVRSTKATTKREARQIEAAVLDLPKGPHRALVDALHEGEVSPREVWLAGLDESLDGLVGDVEDPPLADTLDRKVSRSPYYGTRWAADDVLSVAPAGARTSWLSDIEHLRDLLAYYRDEGYAAGTEHRRMAVVGKMVRELFGAERRRALWSELDFRDQDNTRCVWLTGEELGAVREAASDRMWALVTTAASTGLRLGELLSLTVRDVDPGQNVVRVRSGKSKRARRKVPIYGEPLQTLTGWIESEGRKGRDRVWPQLTNGKVWHRWDAIRKHLGLKAEDGSWFRFHDLRHHFAVHMAREGVPLTELRDLLGHADLQMVERYAIYTPLPDPERFASAYRSMGLERPSADVPRQTDRHQPREAQ